MEGFTKGAWRADDTGSGNFSIVALRENYVVELGHIDNPHDAMLIAAAPELFNALDLILSYHDDGNCVLHREDVSRARAAIKKALGQ